MKTQLSHFDVGAPQAGAANQSARDAHDRLRHLLLSLSPRAQVGILLILCFLAFFTHLPAFEVDLMEARNFVTAREMVQNGSWLVPTMNRELRIAKPPLPTWITAGLLALGHNAQNEGVLRIPAALMATLMVLSTWGLVRSLSRDSLLPFVCAAVLATSLILLDQGRRNTWDIYSHSFMVAALWSFVSGQRSKSKGWLKFLAWGVLMAAAFMSKGPVSFYALLLPFTVAHAFSYGFGDLKQKWPPIALGLFVFVLLSAAWPLYLFAYHPELIQQVLSQETAAWGAKHVRPFFFYLHFPLYAGIWLLAVVAGLWPRFARIRIREYGHYRFILFWLLGSILLLSIIPEKKERYLLPAGIPMAILAGCLWRSLLDGVNSRLEQPAGTRFLKAHAILLFLVSAAGFLLLLRMEMITASPQLVTLLMGIGVFIAILIPCYRLVRRPKAAPLFAVTLLLSCAFTLILIPAIATSPLYITNHRYQPLDEARELVPLQTYPIYQAGRVNMKDVWKVGKPIQPWSEIRGHLASAHLPVVLMSEGNPEKHLSKKDGARFRIESLGCFRSDYHHADKTKCFTLIRPKTP